MMVMGQVAFNVVVLTQVVPGVAEALAKEVISLNNNGE